MEQRFGKDIFTRQDTFTWQHSLKTGMVGIKKNLDIKVTADTPFRSTLLNIKLFRVQHYAN
jgi:hypothetical protein